MTDDEQDAKGAAALSMAMPNAQAAIRAFLDNAPDMPQTVGTDEHNAFLAGKDATIAVTLAALRADHRGGALKHLSADDMLAIGNLVWAVDQALAAKVGVDVTGAPLEPHDAQSPSIH